MRMSDWSSDVCSSDLERGTAAVPRMLRDELPHQHALAEQRIKLGLVLLVVGIVHPAHEVLHGADRTVAVVDEQAPVAVTQRRLDPLQRLRDRSQEVAARRVVAVDRRADERSEEHTSELKSLMRISYAVFGLQ